MLLALDVLNTHTHYMACCVTGRPEPVGTFIMREVDDTSLEMMDESDLESSTSSGGDSIFDSVFE